MKWINRIQILAFAVLIVVGCFAPTPTTVKADPTTVQGCRK